MNLSFLPDTLCQNSNYIAAWCLRALLDLKLCEKVGPGKGRWLFLDGDLLSFLGMEEVEESMPLNAFRQMLECKQSELPYSNPEGSALWRNIQQLATILSLSPIEQEVLLFAITLKSHPILEGLLGQLGAVDIHKAAWAIAILLQRPLDDVHCALSRNGQLLTSGIMLLESHSRDLCGMFDFIEGMNQKLLRVSPSTEELLTPYIAMASGGELKPVDFSHIHNQYQQLRSYMKGVDLHKASGANVLIYGPPGTGKTELVKTLAEDLGFSLFEIGIFLDDGDAISPEGRVRSYRWAQHMLSQHPKPLVLFDEIEDAFPIGSLFAKPRKYTSKAWINRMLESNPTPTVWLSNAVEQLDPAMIRRFDLVVEIKAPNQKTRRLLLNKAVRDLHASPKWVSEIARNEHLTPAHLERAARVAHLSGFHGKQAEICMQSQINATQKATGVRDHVAEYRSETPYHPELSNTDQNMERIIAALTKSSEGRLCLYGPPGTGKTGFAYHLGKTLDKPVLAKPASQLLGMFVGKTEQNIAEAFEEANSTKAILLLDEAEGLIHDRAGHHRSWETTQVTELLMQLERFRGIVIASTNLLEKVDSAAMRRFDFKIRFDYLKPEQAQALFSMVLRQNGYRRSVPVSTLAQLQDISPLTPACFAVATRQARIMGETMTPQTLLNSLINESDLLGNSGSRPIGFVR